jgi:hypothetical protein
MGKEFNAIRHGILSRKAILMPNESRYGFRKLKKALLAGYNPQTDIEIALVNYLIICFWRMQRALKLESKVFSEIVINWDKVLNQKPAHDFLFSPLDRVEFDKIEQIRRYIRSIEKGIFRTQTEIERMKANRNGRSVDLNQIKDDLGH